MQQKTKANLIDHMMLYEYVIEGNRGEEEDVSS